MKRRRVIVSFKNNKALLIVNPKAGLQGAKTNIFNIINILSKKYDITVHLTEYSGDAADTTAEAEEFDTVICCGGDGTVSQVLEGSAKLSHPIKIGYIPCGTTNDLATAIGIPKNISAAAEAIVKGVPIAHDVGQFGADRRFIYTATFGAFAKTSYQTPQDMKNLLGHLAYLLSGIQELGNIRKYKVKLGYDGGVYEADDIILCAVMNSTSIGGVLKLPKDEVDFADGKFEILMIKAPANIFELNELIGALTKSDFGNKNIVYLKSGEINVKTKTKAAWTIDGENAGEHTDVDIKCLRHAASFIRIPTYE
jgi:diacylglycerol kinase (ATP)